MNPYEKIEDLRQSIFRAYDIDYLVKSFNTLELMLFDRINDGTVPISDIHEDIRKEFNKKMGGEITLKYIKNSSCNPYV